jgi:hypothetical protein
MPVFPMAHRRKRGAAEGGTQEQGGAGGGGPEGGSAGSCFTASGPGKGGADATFVQFPGQPFERLVSDGGTGGGGYCGGGGGGEATVGTGGGGGGSDFCTETATITGCTITAGAGTGTVAGSAPGDAQVTLTYTVPPACTAVRGAGHIAPKGKEGVNMGVHLNTAMTEHEFQISVKGVESFRLKTLSSASCIATAGGEEFSGAGPARGPRGLQMSFAFAREGAQTLLTLEVKNSHGEIVYAVGHEPLTKSSRIKIS